ncbi:hypothetical protein AAVH_06004 [Aphelenchoides avenae]|nr:hypothetical protein AAVH_06004 [Aphelenchus avenae]
MPFNYTGPFPPYYCTDSRIDPDDTDSPKECRETGNLWDHFKMNAVATLVTCANHAEINTARPELSQYEKAYKLHTGRALRDDAIEHGFRSTQAMLRDVRDLLVTEENGKIRIEKKPEMVEKVKKSSRKEDSDDEGYVN